MVKIDAAKVAREMVGDTMGWFKKEPAKETVNDCILLEQKLVQSILKDDLGEVKAKDKTQMLAYVSKSKDGSARLIQFSEGQPDSRKEVTVAQLLPLLTEDELAIFEKAVQRLELAEATGANEKSPLH